MESSKTNTGFYRLPQVLSKIPVSRSKWWDGVAKGTYPTPCKISERCTAWRCCDIDNLIARLSLGGAK